MHWLLISLREHVTSDRFISTPKCSLTKSTAVSTDRYESRLQQRGPPFKATCSKARAVIRLHSLHVSVAKGVLRVTTDMKMPVLMAAPQAPI